MSTRERRSLWGSISTSKKVNALSAQALILYVFTMPHLDDEGFIDADPRILKYTAVPLRDDIPVEEIPKLLDEISNVHKRIESSPVPLWIIHKTSQGNFIQDPVFNERQSFRGIRKKPSKIKDVIDRETKGCQLETKGCQLETKGCQMETKGCLSEEEVKGSEEEEEEEVKGSEGKVNESPTRCTPENLMLLFNETTQYLPKVTQLGKTRRDKIKTRIQEGKNQLDWWRTVFEKADVVLLPGRNGKKDWFPTFDWLIENDRNAVKVLEGHYADAKRPPPQFSPQPGMDAWLKRKLEEEAQ